MTNQRARVIGAGLAGSEAAWQMAERGIDVELYDMRGQKQTPAHETALAAELVCSNSFRAEGLGSAAGLLKEELRTLNSLILQAADATSVPAGAALAVDREAFSQYIDDRLSTHPAIHRKTEEVTELPKDSIPTIIATGPLTSLALHEAILQETGEDTLYFYDAAAPIVMADSVDMDHAYWKSRYDKGDGTDYLNCPMDKATYDAFYQALMEAEWVPTKDFEEEKFFEGCMPIEVMAQRGYDTLRHGPLKPVGLEREGEPRPYAVLQLRREDQYGAMLNLVGCQTRMTWPSQKKVFGYIPALAKAEFARYGVMHRNTFMNSPKLLDAFGRLKKAPHLFFAGQMTGVEGYLESAASGWVAGFNMARVLREQTPQTLPPETAIGSLLEYVTQTTTSNFQPMHVTFGLLPPLEKKIRSKKERNQALSQRALQALKEWKEHDAENSF